MSISKGCATSALKISTNMHSICAIEKIAWLGRLMRSSSMSIAMSRFLIASVARRIWYEEAPERMRWLSFETIEAGLLNRVSDAV